jgi:hypothetical protein
VEKRLEDEGERLAKTRRESRALLDQISVGERFMLMFGVGVLLKDPPRVVFRDSKEAREAGRPVL